MCIKPLNTLTKLISIICFILNVVQHTPSAEIDVATALVQVRLYLYQEKYTLLG